jgi:hypothetical protein
MTRSCNEGEKGVAKEMHTDLVCSELSTNFSKIQTLALPIEKKSPALSDHAQNCYLLHKSITLLMEQNVCRLTA